MLKFIALAACAAVASAQKVTNKDGDLLLTTPKGNKIGYQTGEDATVYLNDMVTNNAASEQASYLHLGYQAAYKSETESIEAKIKVAQDAHDKAVKANEDLAKEIELEHANFKTKFGDKITDLKEQINVAANSAGDNTVAAFADQCGDDGSLARVGSNNNCGSIGGQTIAVGVTGEVYADVEGVFTCSWNWKAGKKTIVTTGIGHYASATGAYSAVDCHTPVFTQDFLAAVGKVSKNKWATELSVNQAGSDIKFAGKTGENAISFKSYAPTIFSDFNTGFKAEATALASDITKGKVINHIVVGDLDSLSGSLKFEFSGFDTSLIKKFEAVVVSEGADREGKAYHNAPHKIVYGIKATGTGKKAGKDMTVTIKVTDQNGASATKAFKCKYSDVPNLTIKLSTYRGGKVRSWHDKTFWEARSGEVNAQAASNYQGYGNDIKTKGYYEAIGPRMDIEFYQGSTKKGVASYDIAKDFQSVSLRDLVSDGKYNTKIIGKKAKSRSSGKFWGSVLTARDGNCNARKGDPFIDQDYDLRVRMRNEFNSQDAWDRIGFNYNNGCKGGHQFGGIGGTHKQGSWRVSYEVMPIVGYCTTWNGYGQDGHGYNQPGGGHHPYKHCTAGGAKKNVDIAITRGLK
jgi:hypothetical protein